MEKIEFKKRLKSHIIDYLNLIDFTPDMIENDAPLFGDEIGLDSIDSLELAVLLEREYSVKIKDAAEGRKVLVNVNTIAEFILEKDK